MTESRIPTPKRACPFTFQKIPAKEEGKPSVVDASRCIGIACQLWIHDEAGPEYGNCAVMLTGVFMAEAAGRSATSADLAQQAQEQAQKAAAAGNAALAQFHAVLQDSLKKLTDTVERLAEIVDADDDEERN